MTNCTLSDNSATGYFFGGGGVYSNGGTVTLTNCTLSDNSTSGAGYSDGGGGISNNRGTLTLTNCTLSGNSANDGAISGTAMLTNSIIANTIQGRNCAAPVQSNGHNLDDDGTCGFFNTGDLSIVPANLAPLGDYGGPTQTQALCTGPGLPQPDCTAVSAAVDAGDNAYCPAADQRDAPRPYGSACDIGAYEAQPNFIPTPTVSPTSSPTVTPTPTRTTTSTSTPLVAELAKEGKIVCMIQMETELESWGLPKMDCKLGRFYGAPIEHVEAPLQYGRVVVSSNENYREIQLRFLMSLRHERFAELQRMTGAYQGPGRTQPNQLLDAFHIWCAEHNRCDFFLSLDFKLQKVVAGARHKPLVRIVTPSELLEAIRG